MYELKSISSHFIPCRAEMGLARVLLCHPSPKLISTTDRLLVDASRVSKQRDRRICAAVTIPAADSERRPDWH
jgi:hypothetical protein